MINFFFFFKKLVICLLLITLFSCSSKDKSKEEEERIYEMKLKEAQELAEKIRKGDIFNEEALMEEHILRPQNVCALSADFAVYDFGPNPDFKTDGSAAIYNDKTGVVYYFYFGNRQRYKLHNFGRNPSFGILPGEGGDQKYVHEFYKLRENSWEGDSYGIFLNTEANWNQDPKLITQIPAEEPFLVNDDKFIIYHVGDEYFQLDDRMIATQITKEEYETARNSRYKFENEWKLATSYKGIPGVWVTDLQERNWCQLRSIKNPKTLKVMPEHYCIYCYSEEETGICILQSNELPQFTIQVPDPSQIGEGDLFDIYEKEISPISYNVIGYKKDKYKGTLRVVKLVADKAICEFQTKLHLSGIFKDDASVLQKNPEIVGKIL